MRVGALPQHPTGRLAYAFNWSPEGVVNEYLNDCEVIEDGERKWVSPMEWLETIHVDGTRLEAFTTSGGLGTMCETYHGRVDNLDYKTMRYPGHMDLMNFFFHELLMRERRDEAGRILTNAKPPVQDDVVYVHVASEGEADGRLQRIEYVRAFRPRIIDGAHATAIAWTTAGSVVAVIEMVRQGVLGPRGFVKQEEIPFDLFTATRDRAHCSPAEPGWCGAAARYRTGSGTVAAASDRGSAARSCADTYDRRNWAGRRRRSSNRPPSDSASRRASARPRP